MQTRAFTAAAIALASPALLFGPPSAAQAPADQAWTNCQLFENISGGGEHFFLSVAGPGTPPRPYAGWASGPGSPINLRLSYGAGPTLAPTYGVASYHFRTEPQPSAEYKFVFDFNGAAPTATYSAGTGFGKSNPALSASFSTRKNADLLEGFAHATRVTATLFEGDQQIAQRTFELAPDRRVAGLDAFARRVQDKDPDICQAASGPRLPVPPVEHSFSR
jgi:hypothetical protein